jgi:hypothetical protein
VFTLRDSAGLLRATATTDDLPALATALGFGGECARLDDAARLAFGIDATLGTVSVARGPGSLRALLFAVSDDAGRSGLTRVAARVSARAPHVLWLFLVVEPAASRVFIAAATPAQRGPKIAALIVDRRHVLDSDAETLRQLVGSRSMDDVATHARFVEVLGRDALTRRFFRKLEECVAFLAASARSGPSEARREIALLYASRLLFLAFLESKGWLNEDAAFMTRAFDTCMAGGGSFHSRFLLPLFFGTLNTPASRRAPRARAFGRVPFLNGGLFTPTALERVHQMRFSDAAFGRLFGELLSRYRFTTLEETTTFEEAAIDPEMLGRAFESLMADDSRRTSGAYYTPHELVERVTGCGLDACANSGRDLASIRVLDPACGSGAFLVHVLDRISAMRRDAGDARPMDAIRREVLSRSIFGVDVNPTAVWLCQLRLWLSIVVDSRDDPATVRPLPHLDRNVRAGDALSGPGFADALAGGGPALRLLRERYVRSSGSRKATLGRQLDREERRLAIAAAWSELERISAERRDLLVARRGRDLFGDRYAPSRIEREQAAALRAASVRVRRRIRAARAGGPLPFAFAAHFADVAAEGGFSLVIGNPPWVRPHHVDPRTRETLRRDYVVARAAPWLAGAIAAGAGKGFSGQADLAAIFVERSLRLLSREGALSLLLPSKLWRSLSAGGVRHLVSEEARVVRIEDYADMPSGFDAAVYPGLLVASRRREPPDRVALAVLHRARTAVRWSAPMSSIAFEPSVGAPWVLAPPDVRHAFDLVRSRGVALAESRFGRPLLGVKCGFNDAFIVSPKSAENGDTRVTASNGRHGLVESRLLRNVLRGEQVRAWSAADDGDRVLWTHGIDGPLASLPPGAAKWLAPHRRALAGRSDARRATRWWCLFRTEAAAFDKPRVVWADIGRSLRATVLPAGDSTVPLNTCYVTRCPTIADALALCALLNSPLATAWLSLLAEPARGGFRRYLGWTMALLPTPADWTAARGSLGAIGEAAMRAGATTDTAALLDATIAAYGLRRRDVEPLIAWSAP